MTFRKNGLSYLLWAFYAFAVMGSFLWALFSITDGTRFDALQVQIGIACLFVIAAEGIYALVRRFITPGKATAPDAVWEAFLAVTLLGAGILLRFCFLENGAQEAMYFETAQVTGEAVTPIAYGAQYYYVMLLRGLFLIVGNHFVAGVVLQIVLQSCAGVVWYFAVRKLSGPLAALFFLAAVMFVPASVREGLLYSPRMLYLFAAGVALLLTTCFLEHHKNDKAHPWYTWVQAVFIGVIIGFLLYAEGISLFLLLPLLYGFFLKNVRWKRLLGEVLLILLLTVGGFVLCMALNARMSGANLGEVFAIWRMLFIPNTFDINGLRGLFVTGLANSTKMEIGIWLFTAFLMLLGVPSFFAERKEEMQTVWVLFFISAALLFRAHYGYYLFVFAYGLAGAGLQSLFAPKELVVTAEEVPAAVEEKIETAKEEPVAEMAKDAVTVQDIDIPTAVTSEDATAVSEIPVAVETDTKASADMGDLEVIDMDETTEKKKKVTYIENPLPLPKKHTKKVLSYKLEVAPEQLCYDVEISDGDDFDI